MSEKAISPLQMLDWRIGEISFSNNVFKPSASIPHNWTINAHIEHLESVGPQLRATLFVTFRFLAEQHDSKITIDGTAASYMVFDPNKAETDDPQAFFDRLLHTSAMSNMLGNLRIALLQTGTVLQVGSKRVMLPFINLNEFEFDKDYSFTV